MDYQDILNKEDMIIPFFENISSEKLQFLFDNDIIFFNKLISKIGLIDANVLFKRILNDKLFYELCIKWKYDFSSYKIDYELIREFVNSNYVFLRKNYRISENDYACLLNDDDLSEKRIIFLINERLYPNVISDFFLNNRRSLIIFNQLSFNSIMSLINNGIQFSSEQIGTDRFFRMLKSNSVLDFRNNINLITLKLGYLDIEKRVFDYYDSIFQTFNYDSKMFNIYKEVYAFLEEKKYVDITMFNDNDLLFDFSLINRKLSIEYLQELTSQKISEIVIDYLFKDNIYNVFINIQEMLHYDDACGRKYLSIEIRDFFNFVLKFDELSSEDKIKYFYKFKDQKMDVLYYDILRKLKDESYKEINASLLNLDDKFKNQELSLKYGIDIYDYRGKDFYLLVRVMNDKWNDKTKNSHDCYSLIANTNTNFFNDGMGYVYGYTSVFSNCIMHVFEDDSYSNEDEFYTTRIINRIMHPKEIALSSNGYSEIQIKNIRDNNKMYLSMKPSCLVAKDNISASMIEEAKRLNIAICLISGRKKSVERFYHSNLIEFTYADIHDEEKRKALRKKI